MPWRRTGAPRKLGGKARAKSLHSFSTEPIFLIPPAEISGALPALSPAARSLAPCCLEIVEFWQYGKRTRRCSDCFRQHPDATLANVAKEMAPLGEMPNL